MSVDSHPDRWSMNSLSKRWTFLLDDIDGRMSSRRRLCLFIPCNGARIYIWIQKVTRGRHKPQTWPTCLIFHEGRGYKSRWTKENANCKQSNVELNLANASNNQEWEKALQVQKDPIPVSSDSKIQLQPFRLEVRENFHKFLLDGTHLPLYILKTCQNFLTFMKAIQ